MRFKFGRYIFFFFFIYLVSTSSDKQRVGVFFVWFFFSWQKLKESGSSISIDVFSERFQRVSNVDRGRNGMESLGDRILAFILLHLSQFEKIFLCKFREFISSTHTRTHFRAVIIPEKVMARAGNLLDSKGSLTVPECRALGRSHFGGSVRLPNAGSPKDPL